MKTVESIRTSLIPGEWVWSIGLSDSYLHIPIHPHSRKYLRFCHRSQVFQFSLPFGLSTAPPGLYQEVKLTALSRGLRLHQYLDNWLIRSQLREEALVNTQAVVDLTQPLGWIINQEKSELNPTQVFFIRGLRIPPGFSPCKTHSREMAQTCFDCKMFDVSNWFASLNGEIGPIGTTSHEAPSVSHQGALEISSTTGQPPSLDRSHLCTPGLVTESCKRDERLRPSSQRPQYPTLSDASNEGWGAHLEQNSTQGLWSPQEKGLHINVLELKAVFLALRHFKDQCQDQNSASCDGQLSCGSLHKQTRRNTLSGDVRTPVENHDLVPSLSHNIESQAHSRVPECDGRPAVQVESGPVDGMVTTSTGVQTDMPTVAHSPRGPVYHSSEPQASTVRVSYPRPQGLGHRCSKHKLDGSHCLCFPSNGSPSQGDPKIRQCHCLIIVIAPGWPGMPWFWDLVQLSTEIPLQLPVSTTLLKQSHNYVFHSNPQHLNLHAWCLGVDNSKNKASLWR